MAIITVSIAEISERLKDGEFYRSLDQDSNEVIEVPADCYRTDDDWVITLEDFKHQLKVMRFWDLDSIPFDLMLFCSSNEYEKWIDAVRETLDESSMDIVDALTVAFQVQGVIPLNDIIATGRYDVAVFAVYNVDPHDPIYANSTKFAAIHGMLDLLTLMHEQGFPWTESVCAFASEHGHLHCLQYAHDNGCPWNVEVYKAAALSGNLLCMQYAHNQGLPWGSVVCGSAASRGQIDCLRYALENGCPWDEFTMSSAANGGHLECMEYLHERRCPWGDTTVLIAAHSGHLACLRYALDHGCPESDDAIGAACLNGHLDCVQFLFARGARVDEATCSIAAKCADVAILQFLHEQHCPWDQRTTNVALALRHWDVLRYALDHGCAHDAATILRVAVRENHLELVKHLIDDLGETMPESGFLMGYALLHCHVDIVAYLLDAGCPYSELYFGGPAEWVGYDKAINHRDAAFLECIKMAVTRGWKVNNNLFEYVCSRNIAACVAFILSDCEIIG